jgi:hypothetical protein
MKHMTTINDIAIGQRFSFETYSPGRLGNGFQDVRLEGVMSAQMAANFGVDIYALHQNVYASLPQGTPNDPTQYGWVRFATQSGEYQIIGIPYIRPESIMLSTGGTFNLVFQNKTDTDLQRIMTALSANGYAPDAVNRAMA